MERHYTVPRRSHERYEASRMLANFYSMVHLRRMADFKVGQLVHLQSFTLFDAMSAIEIMDPRMDTGMAVGDNDVASFDVARRVTPRELVWIMDRLLSCEVLCHAEHITWLHLLTNVVYVAGLDIRSFLGSDSLYLYVFPACTNVGHV